MRANGVLGKEFAWVAQLVERVLGKDEVTSSILVPGSRYCGLPFGPPGSLQEQAGGGNSTVESRSSKAMVAGSNPVPRSKDLIRGSDQESGINKTGFSLR